MKQTNGKRKFNDKAQEKPKQQQKSEGEYLKANGGLKSDRLRVENSIASENDSVLKMPDIELLHDSKQDNKQNNKQNNLAHPSFVGSKARHITSEDYLADISQDEESPENKTNNNISNAQILLPHKKSPNLLNFNYIIDRVGSRVIRVYKDSNHSHFYNDDAFNQK